MSSSSSRQSEDCSRTRRRSGHRRWLIIVSAFSVLLLGCLAWGAVIYDDAIASAPSSSPSARTTTSSLQSTPAGSKSRQLIQSPSLASVTINTSRSNRLIHPLCSNYTAYPDVCMEGLRLGLGQSLKTSRKELVYLNAKLALKRVNEAYKLGCRLLKLDTGSCLETSAIEDCLELMDDIREQLAKSIGALSALPQDSAASTVHQHLMDIKVQLSSSLSLQSACADGFSTLKRSGSRSVLMLSSQTNLSKSIINCLGLADSLRHLDNGNAAAVSKPGSISRKLLSKKEEYDGFVLGEDGFPDWLTLEDRKLLMQSPASTSSPSPAAAPASTPPPPYCNVAVALDGSGQFSSIQLAIDNMPIPYPGRYIIYIKSGTYYENIKISRKHANLMLIGDGINRSIITSDRNVAIQNFTTFRSATVAVSSPGFIAKDISFRNTAGAQGHQAVAVRASGDLTVFVNCSFEGYQDTLYALASRQFYRYCDIYGTVDYIFGNAIAVFQKCNLYARLPLYGQVNTFTAHGRKAVDDLSGYVFQNCSLLPSDELLNPPYYVPTYLGRPWKQYSRTVFMLTYMDHIVHPAGWVAWNISEPFIDTLYYGEYENTGPGSDVSGRVTWSGVRSNLSLGEAYQFAADNFISAYTWLPQAGEKYDKLT